MALASTLEAFAELRAETLIAISRFKRGSRARVHLSHAAFADESEDLGRGRVCRLQKPSIGVMQLSLLEQLAGCAWMTAYPGQNFGIAAFGIATRLATIPSIASPS